MPKNRYRTIYFNLTSMSNNAFLRLIVKQLGESPKLGKDRLFLQILDRIEKSENQTVLIFDEAHLICSKSLTDLRLLSCNRPDSPVSTKILKSYYLGKAKGRTEKRHIQRQTVGI